MMPRLAVLTLSESFSDLWSRVASAAGAELDLLTAAADVASGPDPCGVLIAAGGHEEHAVAVLGDVMRVRQSEVAVVGASDDHRLTASLLRAGAADYFALPGDLGLLHAWAADRVARAERASSKRDGVERLRERFDFANIVGESRSIRTAIERTARVIPRADTPVLITGETGTGKELFARAIHYNGPRSGGPFVEINCAALPATLLEAELFGHEKGAFTDARSAKPGLVEAADGGTLFLDEIGDLPLELQAKLLRVLEERRVRRLGSLRERDVDFRVIAATHVDLVEAVRRGRFRGDLFFRLSVVPIHLPPLRERGDDVLALAEHFLDRFSRDHGLPRCSLSASVREAILGHDWPGNVRELKNALERAMILGDGDLQPEHLFVFDPRRAETAVAADVVPFPAPMNEIERAAARAMVERCGGNKSRAAEALGISRKRLYSLLADRDDGG